MLGAKNLGINVERKMIVLRICVVLSILSTLFSCQDHEALLTETEKSAIRQEIERLSNELFESWNNQEYDRYLGYYLNSEEYTFAANGFIARSWNAFSDTVKAHTVIYTRAEAKTIERYIDVINRNTVIVTQRFDWDATLNSGVEEKMIGTYTTLYVYRNGAWKIINTSESFPGQF
jgi:hypothetical protein